MTMTNDIRELTCAELNAVTGGENSQEPAVLQHEALHVDSDAGNLSTTGAKMIVNGRYHRSGIGA